MDKENSAVRKYIAQRAELLGAIRLPNNTFKGNACLLYTSGIFRAEETEFTKDTALMTTTSAKDGSFSFAKVHYGKWIVREIEQPKGCLLYTSRSRHISMP